MLVMYSVIQTFTFLNTIGQDWTLLTFVEEKKWGGGGEREKDNRIKNFYNINYS